MWLRKVLNTKRKIPNCTFCGKKLTEPEIHYYINTCEKCEKKTIRMLHYS